MGRQQVTDQQAGFAGGLNSVSDPAFLGPDQARRLENYRLSNFGAALRRLGTQTVHTAAITTLDTNQSVYGGIYWPRQGQAFVLAAGASAAASHIYSTTYGAFPRTWTDVGALPQYRPIVFTDDVSQEVLYVAGDNTKPVYKASPAVATVTVDATSNAQGGTATLTWSHVFGAGTNRLLFVGLALSSTTGSSVVVDPTGLNLPCTKLGTYTPPGAPETVEVWYLIAPPQTGALNIKATMGGVSSDATAFALTLFGVSQSLPFEPTNTVNFSGTVPAQAASSAVPLTAGDLAIDIFRQQSLTTVTPGGGQTEIGSIQTAAGASYQASTGNVVTMAWPNAAFGRWAQSIVAVRQAALTPSLTISQLPGNIPFVKGLCLYNGRLWGWNGFNRPNSLYYSNLAATSGSIGGDSLGDPANFGGEIVVQTFGLAAIVACAAVNGSLVIWHDRGISVLTGWGQDDISVQPQALNADVGMGNGTPDGLCVANELTTGDIAYFVTAAGIYRTNGSFVLPLNTPQKPDPTAALLAARTVSPSQFILRFNRQFNELWVGIIGVGVYIYNIILQSWSGPFTGAYASNLRQLFEVVDTAGNAHLWRITYNGTAGPGVFVSECDRAGTFTDDVTAAGTGGSAITAPLQLRRMFGEDRVFSKSWRWINILATLTQGATPPTVTTQTLLGTTNVNTLSGVTSLEDAYYVSPGGLGPWIDITITDVGTTGPSQYTLATVQGNFLGQR